MGERNTRTAMVERIPFLKKGAREDNENDPNVLAGKAANPTQDSALKPRKEKKTETQPILGMDRTGEKKREAPEKRETKTKHCPYHERDRHDLQECKAFSAKPLEERSEWIKDARLCFRLRTNIILAGKCDSRRHFYYEI